MFSGRSGAAGLGGVLPAGLDFNNLGDSELQNLLNNMSQSQLMQLFGTSLGGAGGGNMQGLASLLGSSGGRSRQAAGTGRTRPTPVETPAVAAAPDAVPAAAAGAANPNIQLSDLQSILSNIQVYTIYIFIHTNPAVTQTCCVSQKL